MGNRDQIVRIFPLNLYIGLTKFRMAVGDNSADRAFVFHFHDNSG